MNNPSVRRGGLLFLPYGVLIVSLIFVPAIVLVEMSFRRHSALELTGLDFSLENYRNLIDPYYVRLIAHTIQIAFMTTVISAIVAYPVAYTIARADRWKPVLILLVMIPLMTSIVVKVFGWYIALSPNGFVNRTLVSLGLEPVRMLNTQVAVFIGLVEYSLPFMIFSLASAIERVPRSLEEAASNLGASPAFVFGKVILPLSRAGLVSGSLLCFGVTASAYVVPSTLGGSRVRVAAQEIFDAVQYGFNWPAAAALSVLLLLVVGSTIYMAIRIGRSTE